MPAALSYRWSDLPRLAGVALLYALLVQAVFGHLTAPGHISMVWLPSGLGLAAMLAGGARYWPAVFLGALGGYLAALDRPGWVSAAVALGSNTLEPLLCAHLLARTHFQGRRFDPELCHPADYVSLGLAAGLGALASALSGCALLGWAGVLPWQDMVPAFAHWWMGNFLGLVVAGPFFLVWRRPPRRWFAGGRALETLACFGAAFLVGQVVFWDWLHGAVGLYARSYWAFLCVTWAAARYGRHGALLVAGMVAMQALLGAIRGRGVFARDVAQTGLAGFWFFMLALTAIGMALALVIGRRRRAEAELRESEARFRTLSDFLPQQIWTAQPDGRVDYVNRRVVDFLGRPAEAIVETGWQGFVHPDDLPACLRRWSESLQSGEPLEIDMRFLHHGGEYHWCFTRAVAERGEDGAILKWYGTNTDISERKQAEEERRRSERRYRLLTENMKDVVWVLDAQEWRFRYVSPSVERLRGYSPEEVVAAPALESFMPACRERTRALMAARVAAFAAGREGADGFYTDEMEMPCKDGSSVWVELVSRCQLGEASGHAEIHGVMRDISARRVAEEEMRLAALVYQNSSEGMMVTDADGTILTINPAFTETTGYALEDVVGQNPSILNSGYQDDAFYEAMWRQINATGHWQGEIWDRRKNGEVFAEWLTINTSFNPDGSVHRRIALFSDITEKKKSEALIWRQANFDSLTALPNRQMFQDRLEQEIRKSHRSGLSMALLFLDLDRFKEVNDTLGHDKGDLLLKDAARRLSRCVRETDTVARLGGDEFTVILGELHDMACVERISREVLRKLAQPFQLGGEVAYVSASVGITFYPQDAADADALIKNADQAMYAAKSRGRNCYSYFTPALQQAAQARARLASDLRVALAGRQFALVFQPIVELATGRVAKAEALLRWNHPALGEVSPAEFIPVAEDTGAIVEIGNWMFGEVARQAARWRGRAADFQVSLNKSPAQFRDGGQARAAWLDCLRELGLPGEAVLVEVTEGLLLEAGPGGLEQLLEFRAAGLQVAIDDFGVGYSSLPHLRMLGVDYLKIDPSFVRDLEGEGGVVCEAIVAMAHKLGIKVIAEGVEARAQRDLLAALGCDYAQGYWFSRPLPAPEFEKYFEAGGEGGG